MPGGAHHAISAKFDDKKPMTMNGVVTLVDWRNPHVHVFMNVKDAKGVMNWAVEIESPIDLQQSGWNSDTLQPGDAITVRGHPGEERQPSGVGQLDPLAATGRQVLNFTPTTPPEPLAETADTALARQAAAARPDAGRRAGLLGVSELDRAHGSWHQRQDGPVGSAPNIADAAKVAPMQPWAQALYRTARAGFCRTIRRS